MIIDDSAVVRKMLTDILSSDPDIEVMATAMNPLFAIQKLEKGEIPDVITLDVEMPEMDGITFLEKVLPKYKIPVIMFSSLTEKGAQITIDALRKGAFDFVTKPKSNLLQSMEELKEELLPKIKAAYQFGREKKNLFTLPERKVEVKKTSWNKVSSKIIAIGSSTGGIQALEAILLRLPADFPPILIAQHMPPKFTKNFAQRIDNVSNMRMKEAEDGEKIQKGFIYIAPGDFHLELKDRNTLSVNQKEKVNRHRPSVDLLFYSVAKHAGKDGIGVILTGMGNDGALGMKAMRDAGCYTIAQDEQSCVVFGMPKEAIKQGGVVATVSLHKIADELIRLAE